MDFSTLLNISILLLEWGLTYVLHSTVFFIIAMVLLQIPFFQLTRFKEWILKLALVGGILTTTFQVIVSFNTIYLSTTSTPASTIIAPNELMEIAPTAISENIESTTVAPALIQEELSQASIETSYWWATIEQVSWEMWVLMIWLTIGSILWLMTWRQHRKFLNYLGQRRQVVDEAVLNLVNTILEETNLPASPKVTTSEYLDSPIVIGREELCLPERVIYDLNFEQQETLLAHEIAHILNQDYYWTRLRTWITAFLFFQPLNRITGQLLAATIEERCDNWSAEITGNYTALAQCLVEVASWMQPIQRSTQVTGMALKPSLLKQRIQHLLYQQKNQENMKHSITKSIFGGLTLLVIAGIITVVTPNISLAQHLEHESFELSDHELSPSFLMLQTILQEVEADSLIVPKENETPSSIPPAVKEEVKIIDTKLKEIGAEMKVLTEEIEIMIKEDSKDIENIDGLEMKLEAMSEALEVKLDKLEPHIDRIEEELEIIVELSEEETESFMEKIEDKIDALEDVIDAWEDKWEEQVEIIEERAEEKIEAYEEIVEEAMEQFEELVEEYELHNGSQTTIFTSGFENLAPFQNEILDQLVKDGVLAEKNDFNSLVIDTKKQRIIVNQTVREITEFRPYQQLLQQNYKGKSVDHYIWINHK